MSTKLWQSSSSEHLSLPLAQIESEHSANSGVSPSVPIRVLVVDDNRDVRIIADQYFNRCRGFRCVGLADCAEAALKLIPEVQPAVVLLDVRLPRLSGEECLHQLRASCPEIFVIMITGHPDERQLFDLIEAGARGYIVKPLHFSEIAEGVRKVVAGGVALCETARNLLVDHLQNRRRDPSLAMVLSHQERIIMQCLANGMRDKQIAVELQIGAHTVHTHLSRLYKKLGAHSRQEAVRKHFGNL